MVDGNHFGYTVIIFSQISRHLHTNNPLFSQNGCWRPVWMSDYLQNWWDYSSLVDQWLEYDWWINCGPSFDMHKRIIIYIYKMAGIRHFDFPIFIKININTTKNTFYRIYLNFRKMSNLFFVCPILAKFSLALSNGHIKYDIAGFIGDKVMECTRFSWRLPFCMSNYRKKTNPICYFYVPCGRWPTGHYVSVLSVRPSVCPSVHHASYLI